MADILPEPALPKGTYRHYKGNFYKVVSLACHSETHEWLVVYKPLYEHESMPDIWARPYDMFMEEVVWNGQRQPRFQRVDEEQK